MFLQKVLKVILIKTILVEQVLFNDLKTSQMFYVHIAIKNFVKKQVNVILTTAKKKQKKGKSKVNNNLWLRIINTCFKIIFKSKNLNRSKN